MNIFDIDPSLCLGFYCANDAEVLDLVERVKAQKEKVIAAYEPSVDFILILSPMC